MTYCRPTDGGRASCASTGSNGLVDGLTVRGDTGTLRGIDLALEFAGETLRAERSVTFGRDADLELDSNPFLHRQAGAFVRDGDAWWVHNTGSKLYLTVVARDGTKAELPPGTRHALVGGSGFVRVVAGRSTYEINYRLATERPPPAHAPVLGPPDDGTLTVQVDLALTPREVDFLVTFARPVLLGSAEPLPTYAEVAAVWAVSPKTLDNSLQSIKRKFRAAKLVRDQGLDTVVQVAIQHSLITRDDLAWADLESGTPRPAAASRRFA